MNTYIKFITFTFYKSLFFVFLIMISLVYVLNLLSELDFFKDIEVDIYYPLFLSLLNSPATIFEMFPFIFLVATQLFFIKLFENNQIEIFKYSGLKNSKLKVYTFLIGLFLIIFSETTIRIISDNLINNLGLTIIPLMILIILYLFFHNKFKYSKFIK